MEKATPGHLSQKSCSSVEPDGEGDTWSPVTEVLFICEARWRRRNLVTCHRSPAHLWNQMEKATPGHLSQKSCSSVKPDGEGDTWSPVTEVLLTCGARWRRRHLVTCYRSPAHLWSQMEKAQCGHLSQKSCSPVEPDGEGDTWSPVTEVLFICEARWRRRHLVTCHRSPVHLWSQMEKATPGHLSQKSCSSVKPDGEGAIWSPVTEVLLTCGTRWRRRHLVTCHRSPVHL